MILKNLVAGYYGNSISPVINGYIKRGTLLAIVGPNGIGKSTLLKTFAGLLSPTSGKLKFKNKKEFSISYLPQHHNVDYHFPLTVFDVVSMGCYSKINVFKKLNLLQKTVILDFLEKFQLSHASNQYISNLSGGQFQCMLIARILVQQASLILLDEPFQGIDYNIHKIIMYSISQLCVKGCTVIMVLHDRNLVNRYFGNILSLTCSCSTWTSFV